MSFVAVTVEWRRGISGTDGTYTFSPKPNITRPVPGKRVAELVVPLLDGEIVQNLGSDKRTIELRGTLFNKTHSWDDIETSRNELIEGMGFGPGQLHLISPKSHVYYKAQIAINGIRFTEQTRANLQDYTISLIVPNSLEEIYGEVTKIITSTAEIS